jgi:hypothetical protein
MDDLFRVLVARSPELADASSALQIPLRGASAMQQELAALRGTNSPHPQGAMWGYVQEFVRMGRIAVDTTTLPLSANLRQLNDTLLALPDQPDLSAIDAAITNAIGESAAQFVHHGTGFNEYVWALEDAIVAAMLIPEAQPRSLDDHARLLRVLALIFRVATGDTTLSIAANVAAALAAAVVLPSSIFPVDRTMIHPVGVADYWVVRQHIKGYELGEIAYIENILTGETRRYSTKHTLTREQTLVLETERTTEKLQDLQTTDRFDLKSEVENTLKEDLSVKAGLSVKYDSSPWTVTANVDVAYQQSKSSATKLATEQAKEVVQRASAKVTERVRQQQTTTVTETSEQADQHSFSNVKNGQNVTGIYQWMNKVYRVQMFDIGPRTIFDIMVPEPAALLWDVRQQPRKSERSPVPPPPLTLSGHDANEPGRPPNQDDHPLLPYEISELVTDPGFYGNLIARYQLTGVTPPPPLHVTVAKTIASIAPDTNPQDIVAGDTIRLDDGYVASAIDVVASWRERGGTSGGKSLLDVTVGTHHFHLGQEMEPAAQHWDQTYSGSQHFNYPGTPPPSGERESLPVTIQTTYVIDATVDIEVSCRRTDDLFAKWQLETYGIIASRWQKLMEDYQATLSEQAVQDVAAEGIHGTNPDANRQVERTELKRSAIALLAGPTINMLGFNGLAVNNVEPLYPRPDPEPAWQDGRIARFFEEAFEWENLNYFLYPYYWGRSDNWYDRVLAQDEDPLFAEFLRAGQARVVVPVRQGFEHDIRYFLRSGGKLWGGKPLPEIHDADYLSVAEEMKAAQHPEAGVPGEWWETIVPTNQVYLRADACLPTWTVDSQWHWTPDTTPCQDQ